MLENGELTIVKANQFVQEYKVKLSLREIRIVNYLIANIESPKYDKEFREFDFDIKEFCKTVYPDQKIGDVYNWLPRLVKELADKSAWKEVDDEKRPGKTKLVLIRWIEEPEFVAGRIKIKLNKYLAPYLLQLDKSFFKSKFQYTIEAKSKYTIPLYELLKSWEKVKDGKKVFEVDELRIYLDCTAKSMSRYYEFKKNALDMAVEDINKITDINVEYKEIKNGKKVEKIEFTINQKKNKKIIDATEDGKQAEFSDLESFDEYMESANLVKKETVAEEKRKEIFKKQFAVLIEDYPDFTEEQIRALYMSAVRNLDLDYIEPDMKMIAVSDYIKPKWLKIKATPGETKTTEFNRLLNMVENDY